MPPQRRRAPGILSFIGGMLAGQVAQRAAGTIHSAANRIFSRGPQNKNSRATLLGQQRSQNPFEIRQTAIRMARKNASHFEREHLARLEGVDLERVSNPEKTAIEKRNRIEQEEAKWALKELEELSLRHAGQKPLTEQMRLIKNEILKLILEEGKISSFEEMREALAQMGILHKGQFMEIFSSNGIFSQKEQLLLEKIFGQKLKGFLMEWD